MRVLAVIALLALAGCTAPSGSDGTTPSEGGPTDLTAPAGRTGHALEGQPTPAYSAQDLDGNTVSLADHAGQPILLHIWASWCSVCRGEEPMMQELYDEYGDDIAFVAVSIDEPRYEDAMRKDADTWTYPTWWDPDDVVRPLFDVSYQPVTVFIDADGTVDTVWQGQRADRTTLRAEPELAREILDRISA